MNTITTESVIATASLLSLLTFMLIITRTFRTEEGHLRRLGPIFWICTVGIILNALAFYMMFSR